MEVLAALRLCNQYVFALLLLFWWLVEPSVEDSVGALTTYSEAVSSCNAEIVVDALMCCFGVVDIHRLWGLYHEHW